MTPAEYDAFVDAVCDTHDDETAARLIEARCHPPLPGHLQRGPRYAGAREMLAARGKGTVAVTESAQSTTGTQDGAA